LHTGWLFLGFRLKFLVEALVSMPLVLPPSVLGFYLLVAFSPQNTIGQFLDNWLGIRLVFSFEGLVLASVIFSLPFMVHPIVSGLQSVPVNIQEAAYTLGKSRFSVLKKHTAPQY
jgi:molybdate transport system permease protein